MARERLRGRDKDDGSYLALALVFDYPLWTADRDVWSTGRTSAPIHCRVLPCNLSKPLPQP